MTKKEEALVEQYAKSLVEVALEHDVISSLKADTLAILEIFKATELEKTLSSLAVTRSEKAKLVRLLKDTDSVYINNFLEVIIQNQREEFLYPILHSVLELVAQVTNQYDVTVTSAIPLTEDQKVRVQALVTKKFGLKTDQLIEEVDASIIGGFIIEVNNKIIDASLRRQLHEFKRKLI
ncbi:F0F1 ATP synthase subunit delta [Streptococcus didelphis]|uniref:ATP synthase subunit delta n=1 Tax=Streptococcus didelphis TaxID=102886 RepID=A0ABY9LHQ9_9STRE|nr:F0F1 ATP synthase subunit delta [Streptococcus didelphis]WMB28377.1 F0F1 ATP synthase subunit delta [Streptococcus didelphis]WMB29062.1 F0F1 ATP synthase subunit delta [Streptococcus didelphis]